MYYRYILKLIYSIVKYILLIYYIIILNILYNNIVNVFRYILFLYCIKQSYRT